MNARRLPSGDPLPAAPPGRSGWPWIVPDAPAPGTTGADGLPRITVVTPSYNQGRFLESTIRSVLLQRYPNLEYFVLDGGSVDDSLDIIRRYEPWLDYWVSAPDGGQSRAINQGFSRATGQILAWLNSDDLYLPGALLLAGEMMGSRPEVALLYGNAETINDSGQLIGAYDPVRAYDRHWLLEHNNLISQPAAFFRRDAFAAVGGLDEDLHYAMDWDLWLRLDRHGQVVYRPEVLAQMRVYPEAKTFSGGRAMFAEIRRVVEREGGHGIPADLADWLVSAGLDRALKAYRRADLTSMKDEMAFMLQQLPALSANPRQLAQLLAGHTWHLASEDEKMDGSLLCAAEALGQALPAEIVRPESVRRRALALLCSALAFHSFEHGAGGATRRYTSRAIMADYSFLFNRGLWSIFARSFSEGRF